MVACSSILFLYVRFNWGMVSFETWVCRIAIVHPFWRHSLFSLQIIDVNPATSLFFAHCCFWSWFGWIWTLSTLFFEPSPGQDPYGWPRCLHLLWHCRSPGEEDSVVRIKGQQLSSHTKKRPCSWLMSSTTSEAQWNWMIGQFDNSMPKTKKNSARFCTPMAEKNAWHEAAIC